MQKSSKYSFHFSAPQLRAAATALSDPLKYYLSQPSKLVRPALVQLSADFLGLSPASLPSLKCYVELLHNGSLIIDDIQDGSVLRRGRPSAHLRFGLDRAVTAGVGGLAVECQRALLADLGALSPARELALRRIHAETLEALLLGAAMDVGWHGRAAQRPAPTVAEYFAVARLKTGAPLLGATRMVALWGARRAELAALLSALARFAEAFQLRDDLLSVEEGSYQSQRGAGEDVREGKLSYFVLRAAALSPRPSEVARLLAIVDAREKSAAEIAEALDVLQRSPFVDEARRLCARLVDESRATLRTRFSRRKKAIFDWEKIVETIFGGKK